jgi:hypothetical protein
MAGCKKTRQAGSKPSAHFCRTKTRLAPHLKCNIGVLLSSHPFLKMPDAVNSPRIEFFFSYVGANPSANFGFRNRRHFRGNNPGTIRVPCPSNPLLSVYYCSFKYLSVYIELRGHNRWLGFESPRAYYFHCDGLNHVFRSRFLSHALPF